MWPLDPFKHRSQNTAKIRILNAKLNIILLFTGGQFLALIGIILSVIWKGNLDTGPISGILTMITSLL